MQKKCQDTDREQAEQMVEVTFALEKACQAKEHYFVGQYNLTTAEFRCLRELSSRHDGKAIKDLATAMNLSSGRITHILTALEKKNLITREIDPEDRRGIRVKLTATAIPFIEKMVEDYLELHQSILKNIEPEKRDLLITTMQELIKSLRQWSEEQ